MNECLFICMFAIGALTAKAEIRLGWDQASPAPWAQEAK